MELDLATIVPSVSGPKRPHDRVPVSEMKQDFKNCLRAKVKNAMEQKNYLLKTSKQSLLRKKSNIIGFSDRN